jgi:hypothetical protein
VIMFAKLVRRHEERVRLFGGLTKAY